MSMRNWLGCRAATAAGLALVGLMVVPHDPASACGNGYGANYKNCSAGGGYRSSGGGGYSGGNVDYGAAAAAAIELVPVAIDVLTGLMNTASDIATSVTTNLGPTQQEIFDNITAPSQSPVQTPSLFNPPAQQTAEPKVEKLPPGCEEKKPFFGSFESRASSSYSEALSAGKTAAEGFNYADPDSFRQAAEKARQAAEDYKCSKNSQWRDKALKLAKDLDALAIKREKIVKKNSIDAANKFWFNPNNRQQIDQIKAEIQEWHDKGFSNKQIMKKLKDKGYTNEDIKTAIAEMKETG